MRSPRLAHRLSADGRSRPPRLTARITPYAPYQAARRRRIPAAPRPGAAGSRAQGIAPDTWSGRVHRKTAAAGAHHQRPRERRGGDQPGHHSGGRMWRARVLLRHAALRRLGANTVLRSQFWQDSGTLVTRVWRRRPKLSLGSGPWRPARRPRGDTHRSGPSGLLGAACVGRVRPARRGRRHDRWGWPVATGCAPGRCDTPAGCSGCE